MKDTQRSTGPNWHIIEAQDRWYQAVLRFSVPSADRPQGLIRRWQPSAAAELVHRVAQDHGVREILLWELPAEPHAFLWTLEVIATVRRINAEAVQLADVPARHRGARALVVQEAGATVLLNDLWTLERVARRLAER